METLKLRYQLLRWSRYSDKYPWVGVSVGGWAGLGEQGVDTVIEGSNTVIVGSDSPLLSGQRKQVQRESKLQRFEHRRGWAYHINHTTTILHVINRYKYISMWICFVSLFTSR
jgi:hypothetical protein